jgi:hypothetical protein
MFGYVLRLLATLHIKDYLYQLLTSKRSLMLDVFV